MTKIKKLPLNPKWNKLEGILFEIFMENCKKFKGNCKTCNNKTNLCRGAIEAYGKYLELEETGL